MGKWICFTAAVLLFGSMMDASIQKSVPFQRILPVRVFEEETPTTPPEDPVFFPDCSSCEEPIDVPVVIEPIGISLYAAYTYWYAGEEGLDLGRSGVFLIGDDPVFVSQTALLQQPFKYNSGFEVGASWTKDRWVLQGKYVWTSTTTRKNSEAPAPQKPVTDSINVWDITPWFLQASEDGGSLSTPFMTSEWHLGMSFADLTVGYQFPEITRLTLVPYFGLRGAWLHQTLDLSCEGVHHIVHYPQTIYGKTASHGKGIGPKFGVNGLVNLGAGFNLEGKIAGSLLWMQYAKIVHSENLATVDDVEFLIAEIRKQTALKPVVDCGLGFGWQMPLFDGHCNIHCSAMYDFMLWWNQNVMRNMMNEFWNRTSNAGNLYLHGLTLSGEFQF